MDSLAELWERFEQANRGSKGPEWSRVVQRRSAARALVLAEHDQFCSRADCKRRGLIEALGTEQAEEGE